LLKNKFPTQHTDVLCCVRDSVFEPLNYLFGDLISLFQSPDKELWGENDGQVIRRQEWLKSFPHKNKFCVWPDLLFRAANLSFPFDIMGLSAQVIKGHRSLTLKRTPVKKLIYVGTNTSTPEYFYNQTPELLKALACVLPDHTIYFNNLTEWAGHKLNNGDFSNMPSNVRVAENEDFISSLKVLKESCYCVCVDNGISHIAYQLGVPRVVISNRLTSAGSPWISRWYEDLNDCITYEDASPSKLSGLVKTNIEIPQTTLILKQIIITNPSVDWSKVLGFKY